MYNVRKKIVKRSRWDTPSPPAGAPVAKQQPPAWSNVSQLPQQHQLSQQYQLPQQQMAGVKHTQFHYGKGRGQQHQQYGKGRGKKKKNKKANAAK